MEFGDLDKLSSAELRKLITLFARQTTLKNYKHRCDTQRKCSQCEKWFCYACYNLHLNEVHGPAIAQFNGRLDESINIIQNEIKVKVKIKQSKQIKQRPVVAKSKPLTFEEIQQQVKDGIMSKEQLLNIIQKL